MRDELGCVRFLSPGDDDMDLGLELKLDSGDEEDASSKSIGDAVSSKALSCALLLNVAESLDNDFGVEGCVDGAFSTTELE